MEEQLEGDCKSLAGKREIQLASCRRVSRIDSKIYGVKREKRSERRDYIAYNAANAGSRKI